MGFRLKIKRLWFSKWRILALMVFLLISSRATAYLTKLYYVMDSVSFYSLMAWLYPAAILFVTLIAIFLAYRNHLFDNMRSFFVLRKGALFVNIVAVVGILVIAFVASYFSTAYGIHLSSIVVTSNQQGVDYLAELVPPWAASIIICVLAPICEEIVFRGCVYRLFSNRWVAFVVSVAVFTWVHSGLTVEFLYYLPCALFITLAYHRRQRLLDSMLVHAGYNFFVGMVFMFLNGVFHLL